MTGTADTGRRLLSSRVRCAYPCASLAGSYALLRHRFGKRGRFETGSKREALGRVRAVPRGRRRFSVLAWP